MEQCCPSPDELRRLVDGSFSDSEAQPLELHIDRCEVCQRGLQELAADGTFWKSATASLSDDQIVGPGLDRVIEDLQQQSLEEAEDVGEAIELKLSFIEPATEPGTIGRLRHYDILRVAGRGGMGIVLKAFDRSLRRVVAIKLLAPHLAGNGQARQRFIREGRAAAAICHQHVITIHAVEESPPFLVMQYVHGETLEARIHRHGALEVRDAVRIALQIAQGLAAAHAQGVVHRDIKPANILLENGVARVRITDFGLARAVDDASLTQSGVVAGTPQYMAPEQASGDAIDERADLFSLGSVLYTMLAGHAPFRATTAMGVLKRLCDHHPRAIREINPDTPDWLVVLINRLHAKRPADRIHSAAEVVVLLERGLAGLQNGIPVAVAQTASHNPMVDDSLPQEAAPPGISADTAEVIPEAVTQAARSAPLSIFRRALPRWPLWLLFAIVGLTALPAVPVAGFLGFVFAAIALLAPRWMPRLTERLIGDSSISDKGGKTNSANRAQSAFYLDEFLPYGWLRLLAWLLLFALPLLIWTELFFAFERQILSRTNSPGDLRAFVQEIVILLAVVSAAWIVISLFWFYRKTRDGAFMFPLRTRRMGVLAVAGLVAIFSACGYGTWESDVYQLARIRMVTGNPRFPMPGDQEQQPLPVRIDFAQAPAGTVVVIDGDEARQWYPAERNGQESTFTGRVAAYPWRALLGQSTFATGEVSFEPGRVAEIAVPRPILKDLVAGRWKTVVPDPVAGLGPQETGQLNMEFEFSGDSAIISNRSSDPPTRLDLTFQIDESVNPALITLTGSGQPLPGIIRFEPGMTTERTSLEMPDHMDHGYARLGAEGFQKQPDVSDRLLICLSEGGSLRPWQFQSDPDQGISLFQLVRSRESEPLQGSLALDPLPIGTPVDVIRESQLAWSRRLKLPLECRNSIGMSLTLVPPAHFDPALSQQRILLPDSPPAATADAIAQSRSDETDYSETLPPAALPSVISYPFVISSDVISISQFQEFLDSTGYVTDAERGEPLLNEPSAAAPASPDEPTEPGQPLSQDRTSRGIESVSSRTVGGWQREDGQFTWQDGLTWKLSEKEWPENSDQSALPEHSVTPVTVVSWRDAETFCRWLSAKENRQYRMPTAYEWTAALQLGAVRRPDSVGEESVPGHCSFQAASPHPCGIRVLPRVFGEWTVDSVLISDHSHNVIVHRQLSNDGLCFDLSPQYVAPAVFRASEISFRVVAELQALRPPESLFGSGEE